MDFETERAECADAVENGLERHVRLRPPVRSGRAARAAGRGDAPCHARRRQAPPAAPRPAGGGRLQHRAPPRSLAAGLAVELVHCYSLVHDDLPAMDDDDLRRGQPTVHKAFDEATAILAGDALLTLAFRQMAEAHLDRRRASAHRLVVELADAAGAAGMVGGQQRDIDGESDEAADPEIVDVTQAMKTGALIRASVRIGAILGRRRRRGARRDHRVRRPRRPPVPARRRHPRRNQHDRGAGQGRRQGRATPASRRWCAPLGLERAQGYLEHPHRARPRRPRALRPRSRRPPQHRPLFRRAEELSDRPTRQVRTRELREPAQARA